MSDSTPPPPRDHRLAQLVTLLLVVFACWRGYAFTLLRPFRESAESIRQGQLASDVAARFTAAGLAADADDPHRWQLDYGLMHHAHCHIGVDGSGRVSSMEFIAGPRLDGCDGIEGVTEHPGICTVLDLVTP